MAKAGDKNTVAELNVAITADGVDTLRRDLESVKQELQNVKAATIEADSGAKGLLSSLMSVASIASIAQVVKQVADFGIEIAKASVEAEKLKSHIDSMAFSGMVSARTAGPHPARGIGPSEIALQEARKAAYAAIDAELDPKMAAAEGKGYVVAGSATGGMAAGAAAGAGIGALFGGIGAVPGALAGGLIGLLGGAGGGLAYNDLTPGYDQLQKQKQEAKEKIGRSFDAQVQRMRGFDNAAMGVQPTQDMMGQVNQRPMDPSGGDSMRIQQDILRALQRIDENTSRSP